jgi:hypothetical protein
MQHQNTGTETLRGGKSAAVEIAGPSSGIGARRWARALGWLSLALGAAAIGAPRRTAKLIGVPPSDTTKRILLGVGLRELGAGAGLLGANRSTAAWKWSRVAGDAIDIALLFGAGTSRRADHRRLAVTLAVISGVTTLDLIAAVEDTRKKGAAFSRGANR